MTRSRLLLTGVLTLGTLFVPAAAAMGSPKLASPACTDSWKAPTSGLWSDAGNWTAGVPGEAGPVAACITVSGTYTVTLAPWSIGTADPTTSLPPSRHSPSALLADRGADPGRPRQSSPNDSNEQVNTTGLSTTAPSLITAHGGWS